MSRTHRALIPPRNLLTHVRVRGWERVAAVPVRHRRMEGENAMGSAPLTILYQDKWVIAVDKPAGIPSQPTRDPDRLHLVSLVEETLRDQGVRDPYVALHHRLDRDTSGVMILATHIDANAGLGAAFRDRLATKTYLCICDSDGVRQAGDRWSVTNHLKVHKNRRGRMVEVVRAGGVRAETDFEVLGQAERVLRVQARPHTGRTHQIRVHCEVSGVPIVGEPTYRTRRGLFHERVLLHAWRLQLPHPVLAGERLDLHAAEPPDMATFWQRMSGARAE